MKWKYHLQLYEPLYCSERPLFCMLQSTAKSFAPPLDGFSYVGSYCFLLSASHLHHALKHLHPSNLLQNTAVLLCCTFASLEMWVNYCGISLLYTEDMTPLKYSLWFLQLITTETLVHFIKMEIYFFHTPFCRENHCPD